jgi:hypothetical protein
MVTLARWGSAGKAESWAMTHQLTESRLRALSRLLEYALAALAVSDELHDAKARLPTTEAWRARLPSKS